MDERGSNRWEHADYCDAVEVEAARFLASIDGADPATPVPTCPGWTLADLVRHHGTSQRRVEYVVRHRSQQPVWSKDVETGLPGNPTDYAAWFAAGIEPLVTTLRAADPDTPMWTNGADQHARYWARRTLYEAVVHHADADMALGHEPRIDPGVAADGIEEFLTNLPHFPRVAERIQALRRDGQSLHLHATDSDGEWMITLDSGGFGWKRGHGKGTVAVHGPAPDLLLLTYGRLPAADARYTVFGDDTLLTQWLTNSAL